MWKTLFKCYWQVVIFRKTPAETPYSLFLLGAASVLFFLVILVQWLISDLQEVSFFAASGAGASLLASYYGYTFILLKLAKKNNRFTQAMTSLLLSHFIIHFLAFPLLWLTPGVIDVEAAGELSGVFIGIIYLLLTLTLTAWQFLITAYIYKHTLELNFLPAVLISIGLLAFNILVVSVWQ